MPVNKFNKLYVGIISGILLPLLFLFIFFEFKKNDYGLFEYIGHSFQIKILPKLISLSLIPNLVLFFVFIQRNFLKSARGVLLAMFMAGFVIILLKLI